MVDKRNNLKIKVGLFTVGIFLINACSVLKTEFFNETDIIVKKLSEQNYPADLSEENIKKLENSPKMLKNVSTYLFEKLPSESDESKKQIISDNVNILNELLIDLASKKTFNEDELNLVYLLNNAIYNTSPQNTDIYLILVKNSDLRNRLVTELRDYIDKNRSLSNDSYAFENLEYLLSKAFEQNKTNQAYANLSMISNQKTLKIGAYAKISGKVADIKIVLENPTLRSLSFKIEDVLLIADTNITLNHMTNGEMRRVKIKPKDTIVTSYSVELSKQPDPAKVLISFKVNDKAYFFKNSSP